MHLRLLNPGTAATFGLPQTDCEYDAVIKQMTSAGWDNKHARAHVDAAVQAGAYIKEESVSPKYKTNYDSDNGEKRASIPPKEKSK